MRVLFVTSPEKTIFLPMVPLAWALRTAGHEVRVASQPRFTDVITQAGLTAVGVGRNTRAIPTDPDLTEVARAGLHPPWDAVGDESDLEWERLLQGFIDVVDDTYHPENFPILRGLVEFSRFWQPDLVIWEPLMHAGALAAKACGAAHARTLFGIDVFGVARQQFLRLRAGRRFSRPDPLANWLDAYAGQYGSRFTEDLATGHFTIDQLPSSLQLNTGLDVLRTRYIPYGGRAEVPRWLWEPPARPRIALTLGTTATDDFGGYTLDIGEILRSLGDLDVEVVATVAEAEQARLGPLPDNARVVPYVPLHALAPTCAAAIDHAGFGTLSTFGCFGVPQLTLPHHFDEPILAGRYAATGAGTTLAGARVSGPAIRDGVRRLITEPAFAGRAARLQAEFHALPSPNELVGRLEELTTKYR